MQLTPTYSSLSALAAVAGRLNSGSPLDTTIPEIVETVRMQLRADECAVWLRAPEPPHVYERKWHSGASVTGEPEIAAALGRDTNPDEPLIVVPLDSHKEKIGAFSVHRTGPFLPEERLLIRTLANFLAPFLHAAEQSRRLAAEVDLRTRQIEEQRRFVEIVVDSLPVGLYVINRDYRIQAWNKKRETGMQGVKRADVMGRTIFEVLHRQPEGELRKEFDSVFETGLVQQFQTESRVSGRLQVFRVTKIPMRLGGGPVTHVITIGEDVTGWKEATDRMSQADKLAAVGQLAAGVMHEINNPLATIAACSESLELLVGDMKAIGYAMTGQFTEYLGIIESEVHRCKRIVDSLLEFSHPHVDARESLGVNEVIDRALFLVKHHSKFKRIKVRDELDRSKALLVVADRDQLVQVFMALLLNAVDAMSESGTITVRSRAGRSEGEVVAEVLDQGHGIKSGDVGRIFEPFFTTKAPGRGTGLGLSICYSIITEHGGRIEVDSTPGSGSLFRVILPARDLHE